MDCEHVYYISDLGVLVHNTTPAEKLEARREALRQQKLQEAVAEAEAKGKLNELSPADQADLNANPRLKVLSYDPDTKSFKPNEGRAGLRAEGEGQLSGPVRRDFDLSGSSKGGDLVDGVGKPWDVKDASAGADAIVSVAAPVRGQPGENILVDASNLDAAARAALAAEIAAKTPPGSGSIVVSPKP